MEKYLKSFYENSRKYSKNFNKIEKNEEKFKKTSSRQNLKKMLGNKNFEVILPNLVELHGIWSN